jgi:hypothetical protein
MPGSNDTLKLSEDISKRSTPDYKVADAFDSRLIVILAAVIFVGLALALAFFLSR